MQDYWQHRVGRRSMLRGAVVGGLGLAGAALVGCSSGSSPAGGTPTQAPAGTGTAAAAATPKRGGILTGVLAGPPLSFDPYTALAWQYINYASATFSQLVRLDSTKSYPLNGSNIGPDLAEKWEFSKDATELVFSLRKGVKFHNGTPFTAKDVKFSIERMADPKICYFSGDFADLAGVEAVDDFTVKLKWKIPSAARLASLASGYSVIYSAEHASKADRKTEAFAMGTGPFKLTSFKSQQEYTYERNADYWFQGRPYLDGMKFQTVSVDASIPSVVSGQADFVASGGNDGYISDPENEVIYKKAGNAIKIWYDLRTPNPFNRSWFFNMKRQGPWQNPDVRRAMALVIDRTAVSGAYGSADWTKPSGPFLTGMALDMAEADKVVGWDKPIDARVTEAKALLARAGYANGFKTTAVVRNSAVYSNSALLAQEAFKKHIGIDVAFETVEVAVETQRKARGDFDNLSFYKVFRSGIHPVELSGQYVTGGTENWEQGADKELDAIFVKMAGLLSGPELNALSKQANTRILQNMFSIPMVRESNVPVTRSTVKGVTGHIWLTNGDHSTWWFDK